MASTRQVHSEHAANTQAHCPAPSKATSPTEKGESSVAWQSLTVPLDLEPAAMADEKAPVPRHFPTGARGTRCGEAAVVCVSLGSPGGMALNAPGPASMAQNCPAHSWVGGAVCLLCRGGGYLPVSDKTQTAVTGFWYDLSRRAKLLESQASLGWHWGGGCHPSQVHLLGPEHPWDSCTILGYYKCPGNYWRLTPAFPKLLILPRLVLLLSKRSHLISGGWGLGVGGREA